MLFLFLSPLLLMPSFGVNEAAQQEEDAMTLLSSGNATFAFDLYQTIRSEEGNLFYSPFSISQAAAMLYAGADGDTAEQMQAVLHYGLPVAELASEFGEVNTALEDSVESTPEERREAAFQLSIANALWGQDGYPFADPYLRTLEGDFGSELRFVDFISAPDAARDEINEWVAENTEGKIQEVVPPDTLTPETRLVLANAIYFNARWENQFPQFMTQDTDFTTASSDTVQVPMMSQEESFRHVDAEAYDAVALDYVGGDIAMIILLPEDFAAYEETLTAETFHDVLDSMQSGRIGVEIPRFEIAADLPLAQALQDMGMVDAFSPGAADFSNMVEDGSIPDGNLYLSSALHRAVVTVDEEGTEAAAVTIMEVGATSLPPPVEFVFRADKPFIFAIYDYQTETILFLGRVVDPSQ
jgi:serpin B